MSLLDKTFGEQTEQLAVLYCDLSRAHIAGKLPRCGLCGPAAHRTPDANGEGPAAANADSDIDMWRVNYFRAAREMAADHGGHEATTAAGGWAATFESTVEALICAQELSSLVGWQTGGPSLSGGLSAGNVIREPFGIGGNPVREAVALCRQARPGQVLVADPLKVVVARNMAYSFAPAAPEALPSTPESDAEAVNKVASAIIGRGMPRRPARGARTGSARSVRLEAAPAKPAEPPLRLLRNDSPTPAAPLVDTRLSVLGWVQLEVGDPVIRRTVMRGSQARAVTSMLALRRGPVHKGELAELLWPGSLPGYWDGALRGVVTKVRRFFDAGGVVSPRTLVGDGGHYELRLPTGVSVDRYDAKEMIVRAEAALSAGHPADAAAAARSAVTILERRLLSGPDNAWFDQVRAELAHDRLVGLELLARADLRTGDIEGAKQASSEALSLDPYRESVYRLLMEAHSSAGSRGEALRTYEQCRRMLAEELGVGPAPQTQALYITLLG